MENYNPGRNIMDTFEFSVFFLEKYWKCYSCLPSSLTNQYLECSGILGRPTSAKKTAADLKQPTDLNKITP